MSGSSTGPATAGELGQSSVQVRPRGAEEWLFRTLILVVALAPLPLGSNRPLPAALLALAAGLLLALWGGLAHFGRLRVSVPLSRIAWPAALYALACLWIVMQWVPAAPNILADPIWAEASRLLGTELPQRISVNPEATVTGLMHLLTYAATFWLALQLARDEDRARRGIHAVAIIGCAYALYGLVVYLSGNEWILIYRKWSYADSLTSTFVNRNSFATFAGLCLLCAVHLLLARTRHLLGLNRPARIKAALLIEELTVRSGWVTMAVLALSIALVLTASRAGVMSSMAGLLCLAGAHLSRRSTSAAQMTLVAAILAAIVATSFATSGELLAKRSRLDDVDNSFADRNQTYALTLDAIRATPWTGTGFGTFADVFPAYRNDDRPQVTWDKAHNTYLENALELGIPAALALGLSIALLVLRAAKGIRERRRGKALPAIGFAAGIIVGLHSLVDFSLQIPAVSVLFAFLLGLAVSQSWPRSAARG